MSNDPIFINTGRSPAGWSFWGPAFSCDQLWFIKTVLGREFVNADALTQGTMGHIILGHHYARLGAAQPEGFVFEGKTYTDPEDFMDPEDALRRWVREIEKENGTDASPFIHNTLTLYRNYRVREPFFADRILGVEMLAKLTLGYDKEGNFGLWTDTNLETPTLLDCPGLEVPHPNVPQLQHGQPIIVTKRLDLIVRSSRNGQVYIDDHKVTGGSVGPTVAEKYAMDGQFSVNDWVGRQTWDNYGGVRLNLVQRRDPWSVSKQNVPPAPYRNRNFPRQLFRKAHHLAEMLVGTMSGELTQADWEQTQTDLLCYHRFGKCGAFDQCRLGGAA